MSDAPPRDVGPCQVRGTMVSSLIRWVSDTYGEPFHQDALSALSAEDQAIFQRQIGSSGWYPFEPWARLQEAWAAKALTSQGEDEETFYLRLLREGGGQILSKFYRFVLGLLPPTFTLQRVPMLFERNYSQGRVEILSNEPGRCRFSLEAPLSMYKRLKQVYPNGVAYLIELNGAKGVSFEVTRDEVGARCFLLEVLLSYH